MKHRLAIYALGVLTLAVLPGCASTPKPVDLRATVDAQRNINPDARGRPSPVVLRVYELRSLAAFDSLDYFSLFDRDKESLGAELLAREELALQPGTVRDLNKRLNPETRYIGVVAAFRNLERAQWRSAIAVPDKSRKLKLRIRLDAARVAAAIE